MKKINQWMMIGLSLCFISLPLFAGTRAVFSSPVSTSTTTAAEDDSILRVLSSKLSQNKSLIGTTITIASENGVVSLTGDVDTQQQADVAILEAKSVPGVKDVKSNIHVRQGVTVNIIGTTTGATFP